MGGNKRKPISAGFLALLLFVGILVVMFGSVYRAAKNYIRESRKDSNRELYIWQEENYPHMDELYEAGKYEELVEFANRAMEQGYNTYSWKHYPLCEQLGCILDAKERLAMEKRGESLMRISLENLLHDEWRVKAIETSKRLTEEEKEILAVYAEPILKDFDTRWHFDRFPEAYDAMYQEFLENEGYVSYKSVEKFVQTWAAVYE